MTHKNVDVIVIGAGPNGLELGAYLSKAGLKVLVLERRHEMGGGLATEAVTAPGYLHNTHAVYMMMTDYAPVYSDLDLQNKYGLEHIYPSLQMALPLSDGRCICLYSDLEKTCASIAKISKRDADGYREFYFKAKRAVEGLIAPGTYVPPLPILDQVIKLQQTELGRELIEYGEKSPKEIIDEHFENEHVKALMLYLATHWGVAYDQPGMGYLVLLYLERATNYRMVRKGTHMVAQALQKVIYENGGMILNSQRIKRIVVEDGSAKGVELHDGTIIHAAKGVASTIDPHQTFLKLVGEKHLDDDFVEQINGWQWEKYSLTGLHLAMKQAPDFAAAKSDPEINKAFVYVLGYETDQDLIDDYDATYRGQVREKAGFNCCFPTVHDPTQAPPGRHTGILSRFTSHNLEQGTDQWFDYSYREHVAEQMLKTLQKYAPNMNMDNIMRKYISTPVDIANKFTNMVQGSFKQGLYHPLQMGIFRCNEACSRNRTPINNLYLAGSSCYPGGTIIWGAGYGAANAMAEDLGLNKWWSEPEIVTNARQKGYL
jgi:phytoene dehydrogenase-like protein